MNARKSFRDCIVKPGETSPYANLLVDLAFKKAFDPDKPTSRNNLINLLNDLLEPQRGEELEWQQSFAHGDFRPALQGRFGESHRDR